MIYANGRNFSSGGDLRNCYQTANFHCNQKTLIVRLAQKFLKEELCEKQQTSSESLNQNCSRANRARLKLIWKHCSQLLRRLNKEINYSSPFLFFRFCHVAVTKLQCVTLGLQIDTKQHVTGKQKEQNTKGGVYLELLLQNKNQLTKRI